jgi:hypothetical protein
MADATGRVALLKTRLENAMFRHRRSRALDARNEAVASRDGPGRRG